MIIGIGCDIVNIERITPENQFLNNFQRRILGTEEIAELSLKNISNQQRASLLAKYYAAKEAFAKALGTGFRNGLYLKDIQVLHDDLGKPLLKLSNQAELLLKNLHPAAKTHISISDDFPYAQAFVIIEN